MKIVAGTLGGRRLMAPRGSSTRPTAGKVREALFSALGPLDGESVLDLFAGSGALGIEALSRGSAGAVFVERDRKALLALRSNLDVLGLEEPVAVVKPIDALAALREAGRAGDSYDLVFVDPPYDAAAELSKTLTGALAPVLAPGARVVTESDRRSPLTLELETTLDRRYGDTVIRIYQARK